MCREGLLAAVSASFSICTPSRVTVLAGLLEFFHFHQELSCTIANYPGCTCTDMAMLVVI